MSDSGKPNVLLVDDDKNLLTSLRDYLGRQDLNVQLAQSGEEALKKVDQVKPDVIVLDISMPGIGGVGFLKRITNAEGKTRFPVLVHTARAAMADFFDTLDVAGFVAKPCDGDELVRSIRKIAAKHRVIPAAPAMQAAPGKVSVLLAESDIILATRIKTAFEAKGCTVVRVAQGPEVLEKAPHARPTVIVMHEILSGLNGLAAASLVDIMPSIAGVPVLIYEEGDHYTQLAQSGRKLPKCVRKLLRLTDPALLAEAVLANLEPS